MKISEYVKFDEWKALIKIRVTPNSNITEFFWVLDSWVLKIRAKWIPEKWRVNKELISFFSKEFGIHKSRITMLSWNTSQNKIFLLQKD